MGQILAIDKYQENTRKIFINNKFKKKETNICNWCIKKYETGTQHNLFMWSFFIDKYIKKMGQLFFF